MKTLYMAVTADEYELPLYVSDTIKELSDWCGYKSNYISTAIHYHYSGKKIFENRSGGRLNWII